MELYVQRRVSSKRVLLAASPGKRTLEGSNWIVIGPEALNLNPKPFILNPKPVGSSF